jgi:predicted MFS family arabinose efflux permease
MRQRFSTFDRDIWLIYLSSLLWGFGLFLYNYIQPLYITQLGASPEQVGLALGVGGFAVIFLYAPLGLWADRHGRKQVMVIGWSLGTLATFGFALAPDWRWFIPLMGVYILSNFAVSVMNGYVATLATGQRRAEVFAFISSGPALGSILAPALGGWIGEQFGLRTVYFCAAVMYTFSTLAVAAVRAQPLEPQANRSNAGALLRRRTFLWHILFLFVLFFAVDVGQILAPKFLQEVRGLDVHEIGWLGTASAIGSMLLMLAISRLPSHGLLPLLLSQLAAVVGVATMAFAPGFAPLLFAFFISGSNRVVRPPTIVRIARLLTPATMSFGLGIQMAATQLGLALSPAVAGVLYGRSPALPFYVGLGALGLTLLLTFTLSAAEKQTETVILEPVKER